MTPMTTVRETFKRTADMGEDAAVRHPAVPQPELYRIRDAATVLAVSPRMIYTLIETGALRAIRLPSTGQRRPPVRIVRADLLAFIDRQREASA